MTATAKTSKLPKLTPLDALEQAAECLKTLAHPHRLRMIQMLLRGRYTCLLYTSPSPRDRG